jgi:phage-related protein (TIGR01555 family)
MTRRKPIRRQSVQAPAQADKPLPAPFSHLTAEQRRSIALQLAAELTAEPVSPSMRRAEKYETDVDNYSTAERKAAEHAMDFNGTSMNALTFITRTGFPGFPTLSLLTQLTEYRTMHETLADECIRKWGHVKASDSTPPEVLEKIESEIKRIDMKSVVRQLVIHDQAFGGGHAYFKLRGDDKHRDTPLVLRPGTVRQGSFEAVRVVEPYWVTPNNYNSIDPTAADFYKPSTWWMLGTEVHATRLQTMISRPVPDMLKPTYSFRGISLTQLAMPYVDNWLRTQQSVSDTVKQFSITGVKTDLQQYLQPGGATDLVNRAALFNQMRDNRNIAFLDFNTEEFFQINTPLSGLSDLQAQAQEQQCAVSGQPLVKAFGITPSGLNATSDGEIRVWYDRVAGYQSRTITPIMDTALRLIQLSLFGEIDESIFWEWEKLHELTALEDADRQYKEAQTDQIYTEMQTVTPQQVAKRLNNDSTSMYSGTLQSDDIEDVADDDIAGITEKLMDIGKDDAGMPLMPAAPDPLMDAINAVQVAGAPEMVPGNSPAGAQVEVPQGAAPDVSGITANPPDTNEKLV